MQMATYVRFNDISNAQFMPTTFDAKEQNSNDFSTTGAPPDAQSLPKNNKPPIPLLDTSFNAELALSDALKLIGNTDNSGDTIGIVHSSTPSLGK